MSNTSTLRPGDIIRIKRTVKVVSASEDRVYAEDVQSGRTAYLNTTPGSLEIEMVRLAAPVKPKVGDVMTGREIARTPLKRGTVIVGVATDKYGGHTFVLTSNGDWYSPAKFGLDDEQDEYVTELHPYAEFRFVHVA